MAIAWSALVLLCLLMYVLLDGYDLGIGIGTLFERNAEHRREMLEQVAVAWDSNETWLVLLGVSLWAGFPLAFGTILPQAYLALIVMLFALIVRGVAVEMASQAPPSPRWERAFAVASLIAALAQGVAVATLTENLAVAHGAFSGSAFGALSWFSVLAALTVAGVYLTLGYAYLKLKTAGEVRAAAGHRGALATVGAGALVAASLGAINATDAPLNLHTAVRAIGFSGLLIFAAAGVVMTLTTLRPTSPHDALPFAGSAITVVALLAAIVVARAPIIAPPSLTVTDTVAPSLTMDFLAVGIGLNMPLILFYSWFAQHSFRGKPALQNAGTPQPPREHTMVTTEPRPARRVLRYVGRTFLTLAGVVVALFTYFVCQGMFSGYPQYGTNILSYIGLGLVSATGGLAWIIDQRRIRNDDE